MSLILYFSILSCFIIVVQKLNIMVENPKIRDRSVFMAGAAEEKVGGGPPKIF